MTKKYKEDAIENFLLSSGGHTKGDPSKFIPSKGLDPGILIPFLKETQIKEWTYVNNLHKKDTEDVIITALYQALDSNYEGNLKVLRHGFKCCGKTFKIAYFAPASGLNPDIQKLYKANKLTVTRQLKYNDKNNNSLDMVLSINGLPIVTLELKNPMTGQTWRNAIYRTQVSRSYTVSTSFTSRSPYGRSVFVPTNSMYYDIAQKAILFLFSPKGVASYPLPEGRGLTATLDKNLSRCFDKYPIIRKLRTRAFSRKGPFQYEAVKAQIGFSDKEPKEGKAFACKHRGFFGTKIQISNLDNSKNIEREVTGYYLCPRRPFPDIQLNKSDGKHLFNRLSKYQEGYVTRLD